MNHKDTKSTENVILTLTLSEAKGKRKDLFWKNQSRGPRNLRVRSTEPSQPLRYCPNFNVTSRS